MDFQLTSEQQQVRSMVRDFAATAIRPHMMAWDEAQTFPTEVVTALGELGLLGAIFPERYGGAALSYTFLLPSKLPSDWFAIRTKLAFPFAAFSRAPSTSEASPWPGRSASSTTAARARSPSSLASTARRSRPFCAT